MRLQVAMPATKRHMAQDKMPDGSFLVVATACMVNIKLGRVDVTTSEADRTYAAEYAFEDEMPGRTL